MPKTIIADISGYAFPQLEVPVGAYVVWRNLDPVPHTVETDPDASFYFNVGPLATGEVSSPVWFGQKGVFNYQCRYHAGMTGVVAVGVPAPPPPDNGMGDMPGMPGMPGHGGLQHFHGFVTGGRSGARLYMTHTPVIADERHRFQVILRSHFVNPAHANIYEKLRASAFGAGQVQILHDHLSLPDIGAGKIVDMPLCDVEYYPPDHPEGIPLPGLESNIPVHIDAVLHFHQIDPDADYPNGLQYLLYGDADDVFMDSNLIGAPSFHSVARLKTAPAFWTAQYFDSTMGITIPEKRMIDVSPKVLRKVAFVDNAYHLAWLPPSGTYKQPPPDPLIRRDNGVPRYSVAVEGGGHAEIEISDFVHFDVALLNNRVVIT
ncbi:MULTISPECIES: cupredoxin domain-containing protein [Paraburkholderia]|uniref:cupredoxin domain-containing protein n=1 Tax=Paraburkholderia TaxID=1822464 RepID=UPI00225B605A|nr:MULTISPECIES: hypothetical protein [Paraburkholderia]MCX4177747.1 hypothetical protein [Paraburkholderia madseniana]MDQ6465734.1 hypothetical protein [Paraburkholderia madseniana]